MARKVAARDAALELAHPGLQVAAKLDDDEIGSPQLELGAPPQARCPDGGPDGQLGQRAAVQRDEGVAGILARQVAVDQQPLGLKDGHVLHGMHGDVDRARQQVLLDLAGEEALAADLAQGTVLNGVSGGLDDNDLGKRLPADRRRWRASAASRGPAPERAGSHAFRCAAVCRGREDRAPWHLVALSGKTDNPP